MIQEQPGEWHHEAILLAVLVLYSEIFDITAAGRVSGRHVMRL